MGLDIYFYKTSGKVNEDCKKVTNDNAKRCREQFSNAYDVMLGKLRRCKKENYEKVYIRELKKLSKLMNYPQFDLKQLGYNYDWNTGKSTITPKGINLVEEERAKVINEVTPKYDAYFRKVNFLFQYFEETNAMVDDCYAPVTREDLEDIIDRCNKVIADHSLAEELLPTRSGFFFGSTDYDKWYFLDVKEVRKKLSSFLKKMNADNSNAYVIFSW